MPAWPKSGQQNFALILDSTAINTLQLPRTLSLQNYAFCMPNVFSDSAWFSTKKKRITTMYLNNINRLLCCNRGAVLSSVSLKAKFRCLLDILRTIKMCHLWKKTQQNWKLSLCLLKQHPVRTFDVMEEHLQTTSVWTLRKKWATSLPNPGPSSTVIPKNSVI